MTDAPRPLRVLVDATAIPAERGGVGRYVDGLVAALDRISIPFVVLCKPADAAGFRDAGADVLVAPAAIARAPVRLLWEQIGLPRIVRTGGFDVLHSPHYTFPLFGRFGRVVTVHDLTFFTLPATHSPLKRGFFRFWLRRLARRRFPIVAVSRATADELVRILGVPGERIVVAPHGFDSTTFAPPTAQRIASYADTIDLAPGGWIGFLGTREPRKNLTSLVAAHRRLGPEAPALLIAGGAGWDTELDAVIAESRSAGSDVRALGYLPVDDLAPFLAGAAVVAYPSLGEGFGLPVLEAMATGACVLTTRALALPEVGGDAVAYTGPDAAAIAEQLAALLADDDRRADLRTRAVVQAATFTWEASARAHLEAFGRAA
jgi:glycosyltransferase involved in cell wall biosynthesis